MQLKWGSYAFSTNGCDVTSRSRVVTSDAGRPLRYIARVGVSGWLEGDSQSDLSTKEAALRTALAVPYQNLTFLGDSGGTMAVSLLNANSLSGVRVVDGPNFTGNTGAEYATLREFSFEVEAEYMIRDAANAVVSFTETLSFTGTGGPVRRIRVPINSPVLVRQQISPRSVIKATQSGTAVGHTRYPNPPRPMWGGFAGAAAVGGGGGGDPTGVAAATGGTSWGFVSASGELFATAPPANAERGGDSVITSPLLEDTVSVVKHSPKRLGLGFVEYPISWSYQFESDPDHPLVGFPNLPPL